MREIKASTREVLGKIVGKAFEARQRGDGRPFAIGHLITNRCMCTCASCLWKNNDWEDVPTEEIKRFYDQAKEEGFCAAAITGGEPFLRKDLGEIVRYMKEEAEMAILLFTTGLYLTKRMDEVLPYINALVVSVDSAQAERHDEIRGVPGLFAKLKAGVKMATEEYPDLSIQLNCCVQKGMGGEVDELIALAQELGVQISFDVITEARNGTDGEAFTETDMGMPLPELQEVCGHLLERKRAGDPIVNSELYYQYFIDGRKGYNCHLPKIVMFVDGRGNLEYCLDLNEPIANIRETSLKEAMELPRFKELRTLAEGCSSCNSPTMIDLSHVWENPAIALQQGGIALG